MGVIHLPDWSFIMRMALALASSRAVTHLCRSTSVLAFRWYVRPPLLSTMLQASSVSMCAVAKLIVPRHVWAISACVLRRINGKINLASLKNYCLQKSVQNTSLVKHIAIKRREKKDQRKEKKELMQNFKYIFICFYIWFIKVAEKSLLQQARQWWPHYNLCMTNRRKWWWHLQLMNTKLAGWQGQRRLTAAMRCWQK